MLRIGEFARLTNVPVKTLRYYDELGLITPTRVDPATGYRYYSAEQLPRLHRLLALKELGFTLDQVARILNDGVTLEQLRGMLILKRAETEATLRTEQDRLARIEQHLKDIEQENAVPDYEVTLKSVEPQLVAACRVRVPTNDMVPAVLGEAYDTTYAHIKSQNARALEPCAALWHTSADTYEDEDTEAVVPIDRTIAASDRVQVYELAGGAFASATHRGRFDEFTKLHPALLRWIDANAYEITGPSREVYHRVDHKGGESVVEVQYPVTKAS
jgi:DNA-binding transcriptional MerR regulator